MLSQCFPSHFVCTSLSLARRRVNGDPLHLVRDQEPSVLAKAACHEPQDAPLPLVVGTPENVEDVGRYLGTRAAQEVGNLDGDRPVHVLHPLQELAEDRVDRWEPSHFGGLDRVVVVLGPGDAAVERHDHQLPEERCRTETIARERAHHKLLADVPGHLGHSPTESTSCTTSLSVKSDFRLTKVIAPYRLPPLACSLVSWSRRKRVL